MTPAGNLGFTQESPPTSICIVRLSAIGDTCHTVPVVRAIQRAWPDTRLTWIIGRIEHSLMSGLEGIEFAVLDKSAGLRGFCDLRRQLGARHYPLMLNMHASLRAGFASLMTKADIRLGFDRARARSGQWLFCNEEISARPKQHVMDGLFEFVEAIGIADIEPRWDIPISAEDREFAARTVAADRPSLVISPCSGYRVRNYRNWSIEHYAKVADYAGRFYGAQILLTGGRTATEALYGEGIESQSRCDVVNLIGRTTLKQLLAVLQRASAVVCPDSGPAHMSTAAGTPVVGLYATSNRFRTGPYYSQHLVVDKYPEAVRREFGKPVEALRWGQRVRDPDAMSLITVDDVKEKLDLAFYERGIKPVVRS